MIYKTKKARDCGGKTAEEIMHNYQIKELNDFLKSRWSIFLQRLRDRQRLHD